MADMQFDKGDKRTIEGPLGQAVTVESKGFVVEVRHVPTQERARMIKQAIRDLLGPEAEEYVNYRAHTPDVIGVGSTN